MQRELVRNRQLADRRAPDQLPVARRRAVGVRGDARPPPDRGGGRSSGRDRARVPPGACGRRRARRRPRRAGERSGAGGRGPGGARPPAGVRVRDRARRDRTPAIPGGDPDGWSRRAAIRDARAAARGQTGAGGCVAARSSGRARRGRRGPEAAPRGDVEGGARPRPGTHDAQGAARSGPATPSASSRRRASGCSRCATRPRRSSPSRPRGSTAPEPSRARVTTPRPSSRRCSTVAREPVRPRSSPRSCGGWAAAPGGSPRPGRSGFGPTSCPATSARGLELVADAPGLSGVSGVGAGGGGARGRGPAAGRVAGSRSGTRGRR